MTDDETYIIESYACRKHEFDLPSVWPLGDAIAVATLCLEREQYQAQVADLAARCVVLESQKRIDLSRFGDAVDAFITMRSCRHLSEEVDRLLEDCTCGSGGHPRACALHPEEERWHVAALDAEDRVLELEQERDALRAAGSLMAGVLFDEGADNEEAKRKALAAWEALEIEEFDD